MMCIHETLTSSRHPIHSIVSETTWNTIIKARDYFIRIVYILCVLAMVSLLKSCKHTILDCLPCDSCKKQENGDEVSPKTVNIVVGFFFIVNCQVGMGFLGIPFSFFHGGLLAGALTLLVTSFVSWIAAIWVLEAMGRAQVYIATGVCHMNSIIQV